MFGGVCSKCKVGMIAFAQGYSMECCGIVMQRSPNSRETLRNALGVEGKRQPVEETRDIRKECRAGSKSTNTPSMGKST